MITLTIEEKRKLVDKMLNKRLSKIKKNTLKAYYDSFLSLKSYDEKGVKKFKKHMDSLKQKSVNLRLNMFKILIKSRYFKNLFKEPKDLKEFKDYINNTKIVINKSCNNENIPTIINFKDFVNFTQEVANIKMYYLLNIIFLTGMRISEFLNIQWEKTFKTENNGHTIFFYSSKTSEYRQVKILDREWDKIKTNVFKNEKLLNYFKTLKYRAVASALQRLLKKFNTKYDKNLKFTFHSIRHLHATLLILDNPDKLAVISKRLGHVSVDITNQIYIHNENSLILRNHLQY